MVTKVTDKPILRRRLTRALVGGDANAAFLMRHVVADLLERLTSVERRFPVAVAHGGLTEELANGLRGVGKVDTVYRLEAAHRAFEGTGEGIVGDEEALPFGPGTLDLFVSALALQWTNDLPGALLQISRALKPDGLFLAALTGGRTLSELREAVSTAESEIRGGTSPRVLPAADVPDVGALLQRAGFALPVADREALTVRYDSAFGLFRDLKAMGATSAIAERDRRFVGRRLFLRTAEIYAERFSDPDGRVRATFELLFLSGWAPHESQQKPARRGSGQVSLAAVLGHGKPHT